MDENDGVRTRLTHSHEVANLARSIGTTIYKRDPKLFRTDLHDVVQPLLLCIGLAHDLGNPPFGHQGETAIGRWFEARKWVFREKLEHGTALAEPIPDRLWDEFIKFDGNPQSFRLLTKLQTHVSHLGLDLTAATLAASLKYPASVAGRDKSRPITKKFGYFESEKPVVEWFRKQTGLAEGERHPLTWIMEACDDIAYSVLDVDDAMKKCVISPDDVLSILRSDTTLAGTPAICKLIDQFDRASASSNRAQITRDIKINYLRATLVDALVNEASSAFIENSESLCNFKDAQPLMEGSILCDALKGVARQYAFSNSGVLRMEALGAAAISELMTIFWEAISQREKEDDLLSRRTTATGNYVFAQISHNYLEDAVRAKDAGGVAGTLRYRELRLLTDMISGMTDTFAIKLWEDLKKVRDAAGTK